MCLGTLHPLGLGHVGEHDEYEVLKCCVDSGATETVIRLTDLMSVMKAPPRGSMTGLKYIAADGGEIRNVGEKQFLGTCEHGSRIGVRAQVCDEKL